MVIRAEFIHAVKHPWQKQPSTSVAKDSRTQDGYEGLTEFSETPNGLVMQGQRRRHIVKGAPYEPVARVFVPWSNVKYVEYGYEIEPVKLGDKQLSSDARSAGSDRASAVGATRRERALGA